MYKHHALFVIASLGVALAAPANSEPTPLRDATTDIMNAGFEAMKEKDFKTALKRFKQAQAIVDRAPVADTSFDSHMTRIGIAFVTGKARADGKLGDPCPDFAKARSHADDLRAMIAQGSAAEDETISTSEIIADLNENEVKQGCTKGKPSLSSEALLGHYYLSGVMEVGSELRLSKGGSYEWYISYGSVDQISTGTWAISGQSVILTHTKPAAGTPLFAPKTIQPWDVDAESRVLSDAHEAKVEAIFKACPFLGDLDMSDTSFAPPAMPVTVPSAEPAPKPDPDAALKKAQLSEKEARTDYERAAANAMRKGGDWDLEHGEARVARYIWQDARQMLSSAERDVTTPVADAPGPVLPKMCAIPAEPRAQDIPEAQWTKGFAVVVGDPSVGMRFQNVDVVFHFADGSHAASKTIRGGFAWTAKRAGNAVTAVSLNYQGAGRDDARPERYAVGPASEGVLPVEMQSRQFTEPPFETMELPITGKGTLGGPRGRGQYTRQ